MDILGELYSRNLHELLRCILIHAGYNSVLQCLQCCKSWNSMITQELGHWSGLLKETLKKNPHFQPFEEAMMRRRNIDPRVRFRHLTDLKNGIAEQSRVDVGDTSWKIDTGGCVTCTLLYFQTLYTGMMDGRVKLWSMKPSEKAFKSIWSGETVPIMCISADNNVLICSCADGTLFVWELVYYSLVRVLRTSSPLRELKYCSTHLLAISKEYEAEGCERVFYYALDSTFDLHLKASSSDLLSHQGICLSEDRFFVFERDEGILGVYEISEFGYFERDILLKGLKDIEVLAMDVFGDLLAYFLDNGCLCFYDVFKMNEIRRIKLENLVPEKSILRLSYSFVILSMSSSIFVYELKDLLTMLFTPILSPDQLTTDTLFTIAFREGPSTVRVVDLSPRYLKCQDQNYSTSR